MLGKRAPSASLLTGTDMMRLLRSFGKHKQAEQLRNALNASNHVYWSPMSAFHLHLLPLPNYPLGTPGGEVTQIGQYQLPNVKTNPDGTSPQATPAYTYPTQPMYSIPKYTPMPISEWNKTKTPKSTTPKVPRKKKEKTGDSPKDGSKKKTPKRPRSAGEVGPTRRIKAAKSGNNGLDALLFALESMKEKKEPAPAAEETTVKPETATTALIPAPTPAATPADAITAVAAFAATAAVPAVLPVEMPKSEPSVTANSVASSLPAVEVTTPKREVVGNDPPSPHSAAVSALNVLSTSPIASKPVVAVPVASPEVQRAKTVAVADLASNTSNLAKVPANILSPAVIEGVKAVMASPSEYPPFPVPGPTLESTLPTASGVKAEPAAPAKPILAQATSMPSAPLDALQATALMLAAPALGAIFG